MKSLHVHTAVKVTSIPVIFILFQSTLGLQSHTLRSEPYPLATASCKWKNARYLTIKNDATKRDKFSCYFTKENFKANYHFG